MNKTDFKIDFDKNLFADKFERENRYIKPLRYRGVADRAVKYSNAEKLAQDLKIANNECIHCIVAGNFIFGDFIEAFFVENNIYTKELTITTLSMSQENIDSLANLLNGGYVDRLNLIVSDYFFSNERRALIPYLYKILDIDDRFQFAVEGTHTKTVIFQTDGGKDMVIHGSANLRSSQNIEQFTIEDNKILYNFYYEYQNLILETYKTINKAIRVKPLWDLITIKNQ